MNSKMRDKIFFVVQGFLKYNAFNSGIKLRAIFYKPFFKKFGKHVQISDGVTIKYPSEFEVGSNVKIGQHCFFVGKGGLSIGDNVLIGAGSKIITSNHNFENTELPIAEQGISFEKVLIEEDVWLGFDVKVLGGSIIRKGTIVGTNSLINGNEFPSMSIVAGTPAKLIKTRLERND